ncbi:protein of unknown function [Acetoanaerobium sticklandii]|uniref:Integrase n=1 Tax=Acetoanaerobium sticklandii (strain ATCC 12662 / DSM 519 / JCM 1433 / CCUG 9281 / NCIMB 10654 / HF) TaxID=499177 RepID=E3PY53_ACESD|nr:site-specific integrase [Acetoanaerobium sticklandii]CBH21368.1 protein of unknown function [Acetoanaerobium sticklandii]
MKSLKVAVEMYQCDLMLTGKKESTILSYMKDATTFQEFLEKNMKKSSWEIDIKSIKRKEIVKFKQYLIKDKNYSDTSVKRIFNSLRTFYKFLNEQFEVENLMLNEAFGKKKDIVALKTSKREKIIAQESLLEFFDKLRKTNDSIRNTSIFSILLLVGINAEEVIKLKWSDLDFNKRTIKIQRDELIELPISLSLANQLKTYYILQKEKKINSIYIFNSINNPNQAMSINSLKSIYKNNSKNINITGGIKAFQVTFIIENLKKNISLHKIAEFTGHKRVDSLSIYKDLA